MLQRCVSLLWQDFLSAYRRSIPYSLMLVWASLGWSVCLGTWHYANIFDYYSLQNAARSLVLAPFLFGALAWVAGKWIIPRWVAPARRVKYYWVFVSLIMGGLVYWHFPPAAPALPAEHILHIYTTGRKAPAATGSSIEIQKLRFLDGARVPQDALRLTGEWEEYGDQVLFTNGDTPASLKLSSRMAGGIAVAFRHNEMAGIARVVWDGVEKEIDLYSEYSTSFYEVFTLTSPSPAVQMVQATLKLLYFSGLVIAILLVIALLNLVFQGQMASRLVLAFSYLAVFGIFLSVKFSYHTFDDVRNLRDTYSYVYVAEQPLDSVGFWMGERTFTVPLVLKLLGVNTQNYTIPAVMWGVASVQTWFSIFCWSLFAGTLARKLKPSWLGFLGFVFVLFFSVNQEISMWDTFFLSESVSFALFALLLAAWLVVWDRWFIFSSGGLSLQRAQVWKEIPWLLVLLLVTVLYSYARDSNLYFVAVGSFFLFGGVGFWILRKIHLQAIAYLGFVLGLFVLQTIMVGASGRWQIHAYDHLARRMLLDPQAVTYLQSQGLAVDPNLLKITAMTGPEYRTYVADAPEMAAVREWMAKNGQSAILGYLIAYPIDALLSPLTHLTSLLNGNNLEYRYPKDSVLPVPKRLQELGEMYYPHQWPALLALAGLAMGVLALVWKSRGASSVIAWLVVMMWVTIYPLMFIVWHGNPLEIERHAAQIGIQVRLAGWLALLVLIEYLLAHPAWARFWQLPAQVQNNPNHVGG